MHEYTRELNRFYRDQVPLWDNDFTWEGFSWIAHDDNAQSVIAFRRIARDGKEIIAVCNFTPIQREQYAIGVPEYAVYEEIFSTDDVRFGGSGVTNGTVKAKAVPLHGHEQSVSLTLPPLSVVFLRKKRRLPPKS